MDSQDDYVPITYVAFKTQVTPLKKNPSLAHTEFQRRRLKSAQSKRGKCLLPVLTLSSVMANGWQGSFAWNFWEREATFLLRKNS